jgi:hypothetical protein
MANASAGVVGNVDLNLGADYIDPSGMAPRPHHPAFWSGVFLLAAALFLILTYVGGFRIIG